MYELVHVRAQISDRILISDHPEAGSDTLRWLTHFKYSTLPTGRQSEIKMGSEIRAFTCTLLTVLLLLYCISFEIRSDVASEMLVDDVQNCKVWHNVNVTFVIRQSSPLSVISLSV